MALFDLISDDEVKINTTFAIACFCTFTGFVSAISIYAYYGIYLVKDIPPGLTDITKWFIIQSLSGGVLSWLGKPSTTTTT